MKMYKKTSDTSKRVLETLKILSQGHASIMDILHYFEKTDPNNRIYTNEVILKYINTLKVFGFRFIKEKDKYVILNSPNSFDFDMNDLKAICLIEKFAEFLPEKKVRTEIDKFLQDLEKRFSDNTRVLAHNITKPDFANLDFDYSRYSSKIIEYENYCLEKQRLKITYKNKSVDNSDDSISVMVEPNEIKYRGKDVYLSVYNPVSAQIQDINLNLILKVEQLPLKSNPTNMLSSVTFQLKNRLAEAYKLHEGEKLLQSKPDGSVIVLSQKEDRGLLLKRLMRYGENCELISPKVLREEMKQIIRSTLNNYD